MARKRYFDRLLDRSEIDEEIRLIDGSSTDYVTPTGKIYKDFGNNKFLLKSVFMNKHNGYMYSTITYNEGQKQKRVHKLVAQAYISNPENKPIVMHKDNNRSNNTVENLKWGTVFENTKSAFDDGLIKNDRSWDDNQSIPVAVFDLDKNHITNFGSISEASRNLDITKTGIITQCNHQLKTNKSRCGYYFRYLSEYLEKGFVL